MCAVCMYTRTLYRYIERDTDIDIDIGIDIDIDYI
jgi:hypothetical protein